MATDLESMTAEEREAHVLRLVAEAQALVGPPKTPFQRRKERAIEFVKDHWMYVAGGAVLLIIGLVLAVSGIRTKAEMRRDAMYNSTNH